jgi:hypothetical protein
MMWRTTTTLLVTGTGFILSTVAFGQSAPGPLTPPPQPAATEEAPPPTVKRLQVAPRKSFAGDWQLNKDESDDPHHKVQQAHGSSGSPNNGPTMGGGWPGSSWPGGGGGGYGGNRGNRPPQGDPGAAEKEKMQQLVDPTIRLNVEQKEPKAAEITMTGDQSRKTILYTDGRTLEKPKDKKEQQQGPEELLAHWDRNKLVVEEQVGKNGTMTRTYELSADGLQLFEDVHLNLGKKNTDVTIRYVYDAANPAE